jgi:hypothetical protein
VFPDPDLMVALLNVYFTETNRHMPLFHRPTFEASIVDGLHKRDSGFGAVVLLVCAIASRNSNDPRVFIDGANTPRSCGWKWFQQVSIMKKNILNPPSLYDVQFCVVSSLPHPDKSPLYSWSVPFLACCYLLIRFICSTISLVSNRHRCPFCPGAWCPQTQTRWPCPHH